MIIIYSLIGALEKFPYLTIPFIIAAALLCNFVFEQLNVPSSSRWILVAVSTLVIMIAVVVPSYLMYTKTSEQYEINSEKDFWGQYPISPTEAIQTVAKLPEVQEELIKVSRLQYPKLEATSPVWENIPEEIPATEKGFPMITYSTTKGAKTLYMVYVHKADGEIKIFDVNPETGAIIQ
jgi:hypothetical protein